MATTADYRDGWGVEINYIDCERGSLKRLYLNSIKPQNVSTKPPYWSSPATSPKTTTYRNSITLQHRNKVKKYLQL